MQNREVPVGNLPIFFSSRQRAEAGRSRPEVWGGETGRGTRATVRGTQKTEPRARGAGDAGAGAGAGRGTRKTRAWGAGRKTRNAERGTRKTWTRARARGAGRRTQNAEHGLLAAGSRTRETGAQSAEDGRRGRGAQDAKRGTRGRGRGHGGTGTGARARGHGVQDAGRRTQNAEHGLLAAGSRTRETRARGAGDGAQETGHKPPCMERNATAYAPPGPATTGLDRSQPSAIRRRDQSAGTFHGWTPAAGTRNNPPGPFTAGRHPPRAAATCRAYESESRRCRRARRTCCCRAAPRPT